MANYFYHNTFDNNNSIGTGAQLHYQTYNQTQLPIRDNSNILNCNSFSNSTVKKIPSRPMPNSSGGEIVGINMRVGGMPNPTQ